MYGKVAFMRSALVSFRLLGTLVLEDALEFDGLGLAVH